MTGNAVTVLDIATTEPYMEACCDTCRDTNERIKKMHELAEAFMSQLQTNGGPMGMVLKMMGGR